MPPPGSDAIPVLHRAGDLLLTREHPLRGLALAAARRLNIGSYEHRVRAGAVDRPHYAYCVFHAAELAVRLGYDEISVLEFGVAGGNGLVALERHAEATARHFGIGIQVFGFDTGKGLPPPTDYRDLPYHWKPGFFGTNLHELRASLRRARLVIGDVRETAPEFLATYDPPPIAAVMHDLDYYTSTAAALRMFDADEKYRLPRVYCYFDDIIGDEVELYNDYTGERLAIAEFNEERTTRKLSPAYHLVTRKHAEVWHHQIYILHDFEHARYNDFVSEEDQQLPLA